MTEHLLRQNKIIPGQLSLAAFSQKETYETERSFGSSCREKDIWGNGPNVHERNTLEFCNSY